MLQQLLGRSEEGMSAVWKIDGGLAREVLTEDLLGSPEFRPGATGDVAVKCLNIVMGNLMNT